MAKFAFWVVASSVAFMAALFLVAHLLLLAAIEWPPVPAPTGSIR